MNRNMNNTELIQKLETAEKHIAELERDLARTNRLLDDYQLPMVLEDVETDHIIDVTGHKLVELSLRENEARYRSLFENLPVPIWEEDFSAVKVHLDGLKNRGVTDVDAYFTANEEAIHECVQLIQVTDVNQAALPLYGSSSKAELLGSLGNTLPNEALAGFKNELLQVAKGELSFHGESFVRTFRGDLHHVIIDWVVSPGYEQTYAKVLVTVSDITDLRQAQEKYREIFEYSPEGLFQSTPQGRFLQVNPAMARIYGYSSPREMIESISDIARQIYIAPHDREQFTELLASQDSVLNFEMQNYRKDGSIFWTSTSARAVRDATGKILYYEGFLQDITERKQAEEARNEAELRYRALFEQSHDAIFILDLDGRHLAVNQRAADMLGYTRQELLSLSVHELSAEPAQSQQVLKRLLNGERIPVYERLFRKKDGSTIPVEINVEGVHDANGNPLHIQSVVRDITDRRQAEIELQRRNEDLGLINAINEVIVQGGNLEMVINVLAKEMKRLFSSRGTSLYMLSPDGRWLTMQQYAMSSEVTRKIETLIGSTIPIVKIPIQEGGLFQRVLQSGRGILVSDPNEIQNWLTEFVETEFLPLLARRVIRKLIPQIYKLLNIHSTILVPLISNGKVIGFLDVSSSGLFTLEDLTRTENIGRQLTAAIQRQQANESIQRSEEFLSSIQNALSASIVILDEKGTMVRINSAWRKFGEQNGLTHPQAGVGLNYLDICDSASGPNAKEAPVVARAIREVIAGQRKEAWVEYPCHSPKEQRWFVLRITKFEDGDKIWVVLAHENITERKQAQDDIQRSVSILAQAGKMAHLGAWEIEVNNYGNLSENPSHWSDEVYRIFGYEPGEVEVTYDLFFEHVHPDDRQKAQRAISQAIAEKKPYEVELRIIRTDGVERIVEERADLIFDEQGELTQILGAIQDITERKLTEQTLRETSEQLRTLFEASPEAIMLVDPHGDWPILDCNTTACSMKGYAREELIGQSIDILTLVPGDSAGRAEYFEQVRTAGILRYEDFHRRKDGSIFPIEVSTSLVTLGGQEVILGIDRDITERKRAEEALRESEALYRQAIEVAGAVPYRESYNDDGRSIKYEFIGEGIRQITGYGPEEFNTELWDSLVEEVVLVEDLAGYSLDEGIERVRAGDNPIWKCEHRIRARDGSIHWVFEAAVELRDEHGVSHGSIGMYQDITNRKHSEQALRESEKRYRALFEDMPIAIWEEDFSEAKAHLDSLRQQGVTDFRAYFASHPESLLECAHKVRILDLNNTAVEMYHARAKEQLLRNLEGDVSESELQQLQAVLISIAGGQLSLTWDGPDETFTGEQIEINLAASVSPGHEKDYSRIIFTTTDITVRRQAEETLRKERARAQNYLDIAGVLMLALDQTGTVTMINQKGCEILGYPCAEIIGKDWIQTFVPEAVRDEMNGVFRQLMNGEHGPLEYYENPVLTGNGEERLIAWHNTLVRDSDGRIISSLSSGEDITERKRAEAELRESEERFRLVTWATMDAVWDWDLQSNQIDWGAGLQKSFHYPPEAIQSAQKWRFDHIHPQDRDKVDRSLRQALEMGMEFWSKEYRFQRADGTYADIMDRGYILHSDTGKPHRIIGAMMDLTALKQAEQSLRASEERFRQLAENIEEVFWMTDAITDDEIYISPAAEKIWGRPIDNLVHSNAFLETVVPEDREAVQRILADQRSGKKTELEYRIARPDGSVRWIWDRAFPIFDESGGVVRLAGIAADITSRKQVETALRERDIILQEAQKVARMGHYRLDILSGYWESSEMLNDVIGIDKDYRTDVNGWLEIIHPEQRDEMLAYLSVHVLENHNPFNREYRIVRKSDGQERWVHGLGQLEVDDHGNPVQMIGTIQDITERKQVEEQLRQSETRYRLATKASNDVIWEWNATTHELIWSENAQVVFGYSAEEIGPEEKWWDEHLHPDDLERILSRLNDLMSGEGSIWSEEYRFLRKDGSYAHIGDKAYIERDADGNPLRMIGAMSDITERKQVEEQLRKLSRAVEQSASSIVITDTDGQIEYVNPKFTEITGYTFDEARGQNPRILKSGLTPPPEYERLWKAITSGREWHGELLNKKKNGELYWESATISPILNERGETTHFIAVKEDITARKQNESEIDRHLAELEALYVNGLAVGRLLEPRAIGERIIQTFAQYLSWHHVTIRLCKDNSDELELIAFHLPHMADGTTEKEEQHFKTHVSRVGQGISGWVVQTGNPIRTSNLSEDPHYVKTYDEMQSGLYMPLKVGDRVIGVISVESDEREAFSEQDERLLATLANQAATAFENARLYQSAQQEIWDRRIAEDALRQSEENYRRLARELEDRVHERTAEVQDLYDNAPCGYHSLDSDGRIIRVNQTELNWLSHTREEVLGHFLMEFVTDESRAAFKETFPTFRQQGSLRDFEIEMLRKDGSIFPVLVSATAIYDKEGRYLTSRSTLFDDTDRKHAMETLRLANSEMKRVMRMKDEFLASMSHELRTPLNAILGLSESLLEQTAGPINEKQHKYLGTVNESGRHLLELINDILDLAKIESGQIKIDPGRVNINTACETSLRMIKQLAQKKNQTVEVEIEKEIGHVWADERRLKQMMVNLLSNAVKFTPAGGQLGLKARVGRKDMKLLITIWDHGIGIRDEDLKRLFRPFVQLDSSLSRESAGTGLGLALVAEMARLHGGSVSVSSQPGQGSQFTISLPWDPAISTDTLDKLRVSSKIPIMKRTTIEKQTILLVEDTESVVLLLRDYLELAGYKVEIARDGADGVSKSIALQPNLILMDVQMPGMDGLEATRRIRKVTSLKNTPIIALTALAMTSDRERCLEAGMDDYLSKPINLKELAKTVLKHLAGSGTGTKS